MREENVSVSDEGCFCVASVPGTFIVCKLTSRPHYRLEMVGFELVSLVGCLQVQRPATGHMC